MRRYSLGSDGYREMIKLNASALKRREVTVGSRKETKKRSSREQKYEPSLILNSILYWVPLTFASDACDEFKQDAAECPQIAVVPYARCSRRDLGVQHSHTHTGTHANSRTDRQSNIHSFVSMNNLNYARARSRWTHTYTCAIDHAHTYTPQATCTRPCPSGRRSPGAVD